MLTCALSRRMEISRRSSILDRIHSTVYGSLVTDFPSRKFQHSGRSAELAAVALYSSGYSPLASFTSPNTLVNLVPLSKLVPDVAEEGAHASKH